MRLFKFSLFSTTVIPAFVGTGIAIGGALSVSTPALAINAGTEQPTLLPTAKPKPRFMQLAACKPCNPCNPCAAKKGCNPCNPCAAKKRGCNQFCGNTRKRLGSCVHFHYLSFRSIGALQENEPSPALVLGKHTTHGIIHF